VSCSFNHSFKTVVSQMLLQYPEQMIMSFQHYKQGAAEPLDKL